MSITYEEALGTLTAMFTDPWNEDSLDTVLRHFEGHMENTVDAVLAHGDSPPADLLKRLEASKTGASIADMDAQLARQLAEQEEARQQQFAATNARNNRPTTPVRTNVAPGWRRGQNVNNAAPPQSPRAANVPAPVPVPAQKKGRGILTQLPLDFLRIPGRANNMSNDEALARMLQDKLFAEEIKNNPEFAHLARGGGGRAQGIGRPGQIRDNHSGEPPMLKALQGMGEQAKKRFQDLATKVKQKIEQQKNNQNSPTFGSSSGGVAERRGLLDIHDDDEQEISFVNSGTHEMRSMDAGFAYGKKDD